MLIKRELYRFLDEFLAEYKETYSDGTVRYVTISFLWDENPYSVCVG